MNNGKRMSQAEILALYEKERRDAMDELFEEQRRAAVEKMSAPANDDSLAQARHDIDNLLDNAIDWVTFANDEPEGVKAQEAISRIETLAMLGYSWLLERAGRE